MSILQYPENFSKFVGKTDVFATPRSRTPNLLILQCVLAGNWSTLFGTGAGGGITRVGVRLLIAALVAGNKASLAAKVKPPSLIFQLGISPAAKG
jgi:hypothetical protein